jgi:hypothetical protein
MGRYQPKTVGSISTKHIFFFLGQARPSQLGWARTGPAQIQKNYSACSGLNEEEGGEAE